MKALNDFATRYASRHRRPVVLVIALALLDQPLAAGGGGELQPGVDLPALEATTLNGEPAALPRDAGGRPALLVIGFTKAAAKIARPWMDHCRSATAATATAEAGGAGVSCYDVRMLEDVPRAFRGMMEHGMRGELPAELQRHTLLVYSENEAWRKRVGVADDKTAYVIACDGEGRVRGTAIGPFVETELKRLLDALSDVAR